MKLILTILKISIFILFLGLILIPPVFLIFGLEPKPSVTSGKQLTLKDVARSKQILKENDPRRLKAGEIKDVSITERDLNLFLDYALSQTPNKFKLSAQIDLHSNIAISHLTYILPENPFDKYLNISMTLSQHKQTIKLSKLKIGSITIPGWFVNPVVLLGHKYLQRYEEYNSVLDGAKGIENIEFSDNNVNIKYKWQPSVMSKLKYMGRDLLLTEQEKKRLLVYNQHLAKISHKTRSKYTSLTRIIVPLFQFAKERTESGYNSIDENRALIFTLAVYVVGKHPGEFLGIKNYKRPRNLKLTLLDRHDLAQHFLISAAITASAGSGLANLAGLFKEMDDSRGGSGFSFADLAADQAGVRLAEHATGSARKATLLQKEMSAVSNEYDYMPQVDHLPEGISELEFKVKYNDLEDKRYIIIDKEIKRRINSCRIYDKF